MRRIRARFQTVSTACLLTLVTATAKAVDIDIGCEDGRDAVAEVVSSVDDAAMKSWFDGPWWNPFHRRWCSTGSQGQFGWARTSGPPTTDAGDRFGELYRDVLDGRPVLPAEAADHVYLVIKGLYGNQLAGYMEANRDRLEDRGLDARLVPIDTEAGVERNAARIRDAILAATRTGKKVVIVGHSKGGVDTTAALSLYPELKDRVRALVAIQSPYGGSPVAEDIQGCNALRRITDGFVKNIWGGSPQSMIDLTYRQRRAFIAAHPFPSDVPTVSLASSRVVQLSSVMWKTAYYARYRYGKRSDGLVLPEDAEIPGSRVVRLDDMDHAEGGLVGVPGLRKHHPGDITEALVALALQ